MKFNLCKCSGEPNKNFKVVRYRLGGELSITQRERREGIGSVYRLKDLCTESLILAQSERWRRG